MWGRTLKGGHKKCKEILGELKLIIFRKLQDFIEE